MRAKNYERMNTVAKYVEEYQKKHLKSPSVRTIAKDLEMSHSTVYKYLTDMNELGMIAYDGEQVVLKSTEKLDRDFVSAPILGSVSCGFPLLDEQNVEKYVNIPRAFVGEENGEYIVVRANGDSMTGAGIEDNDLVIVRIQKNAEPGQIVIALVDGCSTTLKRYMPEPENHRIVLHAENPAVEDIIVNTCEIQGVAIRVLKRL